MLIREPCKRNSIILEVADDGIGISDEEKVNIFGIDFIK